MTWRRRAAATPADRGSLDLAAAPCPAALELISGRGHYERVIRAVVDAQQDFFEKGPEYLKPLPMILVADQLGIHVATVSRAVSEKPLMISSRIEFGSSVRGLSLVT